MALSSLTGALIPSGRVHGEEDGRTLGSAGRHSPGAGGANSESDLAYFYSLNRGMSFDMHLSEPGRPERVDATRLVLVDAAQGNRNTRWRTCCLLRRLIMCHEDGRPLALPATRVK